jgi:release factor glutamine methyltransferase
LDLGLPILRPIRPGQSSAASKVHQKPYGISIIAKIIFTMTNSKELFNDLVSRISLKEEKSELQSIIYLLLEKKLGLSKTEILAGKVISSLRSDIFDSIIRQINDHTPIQYILGEAEFYGRPFKVTPCTLIPRPETELLVNKIISEVLKRELPSPKILDIGTGSGCIATTLALEILHSMVQATDLSKEAIIVAQENAKELNASVNFAVHNILTEEIYPGKFDLIVSNPPYISAEEKTAMKKNVLDYEPHLALFAPANDPLAFYKAIALKGKSALTHDGSVWVEINERFGKEVMSIFKNQGYSSVHIIKDLDNKDRIACAYL